MIEGLKISNFQSHRDSSLEFSPGVNALVGDSDCGKSAVMRALLWVITNQPQGDAHVSNWLKDKKGKVKGLCQVSVLVDAGVITRSRGKDENSYELHPWNEGTPLEDSQAVRFEAMRSDVPVEISRTFGIGPVNIQRQMDPPFLISATPGEAARYINSLVDLSEIDTAMSVTNSMSRECSADMKAANEAVLRLEGEVGSLGWVQELERLTDSVESLEGSLKEAQGKHGTLTDELGRLEAAARQWASVDLYVKEVEKVLERLEKVSRSLDGAMSKYNRLNKDFLAFKAVEKSLRGMERVDEVSGLLDRAGELLGALDKSRRLLDAGKLEEYTGAARSASLDLEKVEKVLSRLSRMGSALEGTRESLERSQNDLSNLHRGLEVIGRADREIEELERSLEGKVCPCCGRPIHRAEK